MDELIQFPRGGTILTQSRFSELSFISHGVTTRKGGCSLGEYGQFNQGLNTGDDTSLVHANRNILAEGLGISLHKMVYAQQVHGTHVACIDQDFLTAVSEGQPLVSAQTDALITRMPGIALNILTADCIPVFIVDTRCKSIGLAHAGWRGTYEGIAGKTLHAMKECFGTVPRDCLAWIGTGICESCYEVSEELSMDFTTRFKSLGFCSRDHHLDLMNLNSLQLQDAGMTPEAIEISGYCSCHHPELFYSYRRSAGMSGRMASFLLLK